MSIHPLHSTLYTPCLYILSTSSSLSSLLPYSTFSTLPPCTIWCRVSPLYSTLDILVYTYQSVLYFIPTSLLYVLFCILNALFFSILYTLSLYNLSSLFYTPYSRAYISVVSCILSCIVSRESSVHIYTHAYTYRHACIYSHAHTHMYICTWFSVL